MDCGSHYASSCAGCPQENGASWCNGDCKWCDGNCQMKNDQCGNGAVLQIKTDCSQYTQEDGLTPEWMDIITNWDPGMTTSFEFCQNSQDGLTPPKCCFTGFLSGDKQRCKEIQYGAHELGSCGKFNFDFDSVESIKMRHITLQGHEGSILTMSPDFDKKAF